jgi:hypothetical protein
MEFTSGDQIMKLSQHIIDKHHGKMYLPYEMIKNEESSQCHEKS